MNNVLHGGKNGKLMNKGGLFQNKYFFVAAQNDKRFMCFVPNRIHPSLFKAKKIYYYMR